MDDLFDVFDDDSAALTPSLPTSSQKKRPSRPTEPTTHASKKKRQTEPDGEAATQQEQGGGAEQPALSVDASADGKANEASSSAGLHLLC